jgi:hypothetical protein
MVDLEGPPPHSAAVSSHQVSRHHCGQVDCRFLLQIVLCLLVCFIWFLHCCHCSRSSSFDQPVLSFLYSFYLSLHFLLVLGCRLVPPSLGFLGAVLLLRSSPFVLGVGLDGAPIPRRCLGSAPIHRRGPRPLWWWSASVPQPRLGGPPRPHLGALNETFGLASVLRLKPLASPCRCSSSAPCLSSMLRTKPLALPQWCSSSLLSVCFWLIVECRAISKNTSDSHLQFSLFILYFPFFLLLFYRCILFRFFIRLLQNTK